VAGTIKNKVKNIYNAIMKRVTQAFNYIKRLGKKLIEGLMNFLGVEVSDVTVNKGRGDFALL
jgi:phage-related protein